MKKALVVDDTKASRILLTKCLENEGYSVSTAGKGKQAMELLTAERYDLVFLDIKMPYMSGTEVFKWMLKSDITTPVVITTAYATVKNAVECTRMGAIAYLQKPFTVERFKEFIAEIERQLSDRNMEKEKTEEQDSLQIAKKELECGNSEEALIYLKQALSQNPANPEIYLLLSKTYSLMGDKEYAAKFMSAYEAFKGTS